MASQLLTISAVLLLHVCSYHTIQGKAVAAADLKDGQQLTTISQHKLTVKINK